MSNHKGHLVGGCIAYGITLVGIVAYMHMSQDFKIVSAKDRTLLAHFPAFIVDVENTIHHHFPLLVSCIKWMFTLCWSFLFIGIEWFIFALAGAMFPDIDIKSTSQRYLYGILFIGLLALIGKKKFYTAAFLGIVAIVPIFSNHRGIFHRPWFVVLLPLATWYWIGKGFPHLSLFFFYDMMFFISGALSHLWLDMGIKMLKPRI